MAKTKELKKRSWGQEMIVFVRFGSRLPCERLLLSGKVACCTHAEFSRDTQRRNEIKASSCGLVGHAIARGPCHRTVFMIATLPLHTSSYTSGCLVFT